MILNQMEMMMTMAMVNRNNRWLRIIKIPVMKIKSHTRINSKSKKKHLNPTLWKSISWVINIKLNRSYLHQQRYHRTQLMILTKQLTRSLPKKVKRRWMLWTKPWNALTRNKICCRRNAMNMRNLSKGHKLRKGNSKTSRNAKWKILRKWRKKRCKSLRKRRKH